MYLARFSYDVRPADRRRALDLIRREVAAARRDGRDARPDEDVGELMHAFSEILLAPPAVEILRVDETPAPAP